MAPVGDESTHEKDDIFLNSFRPEVKRLLRKLNQTQPQNSFSRAHSIEEQSYLRHDWNRHDLSSCAMISNADFPGRQSYFTREIVMVRNANLWLLFIIIKNDIVWGNGSVFDHCSNTDKATLYKSLILFVSLL